MNTLALSEISQRTSHNHFFTLQKRQVHVLNNKNEKGLELAPSRPFLDSHGIITALLS